MKTVKENSLNKLLWDDKEGLLIKFHFKKGLDMSLLDILYENLELLKLEWKDKEEVSKSILFYLTPICSVLRRDLDLYIDDEVKHCQYEEVIDNLENAISMCLNPNINDEHFDKRLKDLGDI